MTLSDSDLENIANHLWKKHPYPEGDYLILLLVNELREIRKALISKKQTGASTQ